MTHSYRIDGMTCEGCARAITAAIQSAVPDAAVGVDLAEHRVRVEGADEQAVAKAAEEAGFVYRGEIRVQSTSVPDADLTPPSNGQQS